MKIESGKVKGAKLPAKTTINLVMKEETSVTPVKFAIYALAALVVFLAVAKFGFLDQYARLSKAQAGAPKKIPKRPPGGGSAAHPGSAGSGSGSGSSDEPNGGGDLGGSPYSGSGQ